MPDAIRSHVERSLLWVLRPSSRSCLPPRDLLSPSGPTYATNAATCTTSKRRVLLHRFYDELYVFAPSRSR